MSQMERICSFHKEVKKGSYPTSKHIIDTFQVSESSARRDIDYLRDRLDAPLEYDIKKKGFYYQSLFSLPSDDTQHVAFLLGIIHKIAKEAGLDNFPEIQEIKKKLSQLLSLDVQKIEDIIYFEKPEAEAVSPAVIETLMDAIRSGTAVKFKYHKLNGSIEDRKIDPCRLINLNWRWYVLGYCHLRKSIRIFNLSRIKDVSMLKDKKSAYCGADINKLLESSFGIYKGKKTHKAKILFKGELASVVENQFWHPLKKVKKIKDGIILTIPVADWTEIKMKVLQYGSEAEVIAPKKLREIIKEEARRMSVIYS